MAYNQTTGVLEREATMYQSGGFPENFHIYDPQNYLVEGLNILAIEGHNSKASSTDFSLIPMLSLGMEGTDYINSISQYIQIERNELHTNFKLDTDGESLLLLDPGGNIADTIPVRSLQADISHGRKPDGSSSWYYFATPTPGTSNNTTAYSNSYRDSIKFSVPGGYYPGSASVALSTNNSADSVFYTLDGTDPDSSSNLYELPVPITGNVVIKARIIADDKLPGTIYTNTYFSEQHHLPVICLSTDPENLWNYYSGIYVKGPNASSSYPYKGANFWQDWEKKAHMEYYDSEGEKQVDQGIGIKIYGAFSRAHPQKSLALFARSEYGKGSFQYSFFKDKPIDKFEALVLRNSGNDWNQAFMRDALTTSLIKDMNIDRLALQPVILYLNGEYWGILNLREKINSHYLAENHYVDPESVNLLEDNSVTLDGSNTSYLSLISYLNTHTLVNEQYYQQVIEKIDLDNYIQYEIAQIYAHNKDWPGNNIKFWNLNEAGSKWRWIIFDTDVGWGLRDTYAFNSLEFSLQPNSSDDNNPPWSTLLLRRLMTNPGFKKDFINQFADRINTTFTPERVNFILDSLRNIYQPEIQSHLSRWELSYNNWQNSHY
ncbi:MAG: CotH kinase family protein, partial [Bacteroidales bacterium]|nr:CotH kinase family protein [Bacteroidales bacterium]